MLCGNYLSLLTNLKILLNENMTYCKMGKPIKKLNSIPNQLNSVPKIIITKEKVLILISERRKGV